LFKLNLWRLALSALPRCSVYVLCVLSFHSVFFGAATALEGFARCILDANSHPRALSPKPTPPLSFSLHCWVPGRCLPPTTAAEDAAEVEGAEDGGRHGRWQGPQEGQFARVKEGASRARFVACCCSGPSREKEKASERGGSSTLTPYFVFCKRLNVGLRCFQAPTGTLFDGCTFLARRHGAPLCGRAGGRSNTNRLEIWAGNKSRRRLPISRTALVLHCGQRYAPYQANAQRGSEWNSTSRACWRSILERRTLPGCMIS